MSAATETLVAWVASRTPPAPAELLEYMAADLQAAGHASVGVTGAGLAPALLDASSRALERVLASARASRAVAFDLLVSDAYVTYAFEAAADDPGSLVAAASDAMRQISAIAVHHFESAGGA